MLRVIHGYWIRFIRPYTLVVEDETQSSTFSQMKLFVRQVFPLIPIRINFRQWTDSTLYSSNAKIDTHIRLRQLIHSKTHDEALSLLKRESGKFDDVTWCSMIKICTREQNHLIGLKIYENLTERSLRNPFIQSSLIHFFSNFFNLFLFDK